MKITMKTLQTYGTSEICPQCQHIRAFNEQKPGLGHTKECGDRIMDSMMGDPAGARRLQADEQRQARGRAQDIPAEEESTPIQGE